MNFRELPEFKRLHDHLIEFSKDSKMSTYYAFGDTKELIKAIIQHWLDKNEIDETHIRLERVHFERPKTYSWSIPYYHIKANQIQIYNGKGSLDKKSRWLNKITIRHIWSSKGVKAKLVNAVARTDKNFLEPTPTNFQSFMQELFEPLVLDDK